MHQGELKLYRAVMLQAAQDIADSNRIRHRNPLGTGSINAVQGHYSALQWLADDVDYPFSFRNCCQVLGLNARRARERLMRLARFEVSGRREFCNAALQGWAA